MPVSTDDIDKFRRQYLEIVSYADVIAQVVAREVTEVLRRQSVHVALSVSSRVKEFESIERKLRSERVRVRHLLELQDVIGVRIVLLHQGDARRALQIIEESFSVERKYDTRSRLASDQFGYTSVHVIARLPDAWLELPSLRRRKLPLIEIQVRTLFQHAWAELSNHFQYKKECDAPPVALRTLYGIAAQLEMMDHGLEEFASSVLASRSRNMQDIAAEDELNVDLVVVVASGVFPGLGEGDESSASDILQRLRDVGIVRKVDLVGFFEGLRSYGIAYFKWCQQAEGYPPSAWQLMHELLLAAESGERYPYEEQVQPEP